MSPGPFFALLETLTIPLDTAISHLPTDKRVALQRQYNYSSVNYSLKILVKILCITYEICSDVVRIHIVSQFQILL